MGRRSFSREFKLEAVRLVRERGVSVAQAARDLDMHMIFGFVAKHRGIWPVAFLCEALGVSRSGFYAWLTRGPSARSRRDEVLSVQIRSSFQDSYRTYGARRVWHDVLAAGIECGLHAIERLMRRNGLRARPRRRRLPIDLGDRPTAALSASVLDRSFGGSRRPTANGWPTSPTSGPARAGYMWRPSSTCSRAEWSAGR